MPETRTFKMHPQLLFDVIQRQAGTLAKALLEGVMNGVDAGATKIEIEVPNSGKTVRITDNGKGFQNRQEIEGFFETFGLPHDESENKVYGTFRMGRGQMFAFGKNEWRTGNFSMSVDIKHKGLDYQLKDNLDTHQGCRIDITLYEALLPSAISGLEREIQNLVKYVSIPVCWNGKQIFCDPATKKWDIETPDAYINLRDTSSLSVYHLGVFILQYPSSRYGTGGVVVAKQQLKVNFARNDIQADCKIWKRVQKHLQETSDKKLSQKSGPITDDQRQYLAESLKAGTMPLKDKWKKKFVTDVAGIHWSLGSLSQHIKKNNITSLTVAPLHDQRGDILMQERSAVVLAKETLDRFGCENLEELVNILAYKGGAHGMKELEQKKYEEAVKEMSGDYNIVPSTRYTKNEQLVLDFLKRAQYTLISRRHDKRERTLVVGDSEVYDGWTDGERYIAIHRKFLNASGEVSTWTKLGMLLIHEYAHDSSSEGSHVHGAEFYSVFHDIAREKLADFIAHCVAHYPRYLERTGKKLTKQVLKLQDRQRVQETHKETLVKLGVEMHEGIGV